KTARDLVATFGGLDEIYANLDQIKKPALRQKLAEHRDLAFMSKELATLRFDVPLDIPPEDMKIQEPDLFELRRIFRELELVSLYKEVRMEDKDVPHPEASELRDVLTGPISVVARIHG